MSLELIELQSFSAASPLTRSGTKSPPMCMHPQNGQSALRGRKQLVCYQIFESDRQQCMQATFSHHIHDSPAKGLTNYLRCYGPALLREHTRVENAATTGMVFGETSGSSRTFC